MSASIDTIDHHHRHTAPQRALLSHSYWQLCAVVTVAVGKWAAGSRLNALSVWIERLHLGVNISFSIFSFLLLSCGLRLVFDWCTWLQSGQKNDLLHQHFVHGWRSSVRIAHAGTLYLVCECSNYWKFSRHVNIPVSIYHCYGNRQTVSKIMTDHIDADYFILWTWRPHRRRRQSNAIARSMVWNILSMKKMCKNRREESSLISNEFWRRKIGLGCENVDISIDIRRSGAIVCHFEERVVKFVCLLHRNDSKCHALIVMLFQN